MSYAGYLIKVNGAIVPNRFIDTKSYVSKPEIRRVIKSYYTSDGVKHEIYSTHTTSEISFNTNDMKLPKKNAFLTYFPATSGLTVEYWHERTGEYYTRNNFELNDLEFKHHKGT